jgi:predicted nucleic-acid-binding Zn-ribbon protein
MIGITCGICGFSGDAMNFTPPDQEDGPDWICPKCGCGVYVPATLTADDFISFEVVDEKAV